MPYKDVKDRRENANRYSYENREKKNKYARDLYAKQDRKMLYQKRKIRQIELGHSNYYDRPDRCIKMYQRNAKKTGREFLLSIEDFKVFWQKPCFYCGSPILTIGIDRIDNKKGYILDNIVTCCSTCNWMKSKLDQIEFIAKCKSIAIHFTEVENVEVNDK